MHMKTFGMHLTHKYINEAPEHLPPLFFVAVVECTVPGRQTSGQKYHSIRVSTVMDYCFGPPQLGCSGENINV